MKRAAKRKKQKLSNSKSIGPAKQTVAAIESVFRSTHKRDMTADERKMFGLRPLAKLKN